MASTDNNSGSRRGFLNRLIQGASLALLTSVFYPIYKFNKPPASGEANISQVKLPFDLKELMEDEKKFRIFKFGREAGIILVTREKEVKAFSAICTHLSCTLQYRADLSMVWCACHNGRFDLEGRNISGPPPQPIEQYAVHLNSTTGEIFVSRNES